jgi:hypothetical protein
MFNGAQIKPGTVASLQLKDNSVTGADIKAHSIAPTDLSSQTAAALHGSEGPKGDAGAPGAKGDMGPQGPVGSSPSTLTLTTLNANPSTATLSDLGAMGTLTATCFTVSANSSSLRLEFTRPVGAPGPDTYAVWHVTVSNISQSKGEAIPGGATTQFTVASNNNDTGSTWDLTVTRGDTAVSYTLAAFTAYQGAEKCQLTLRTLR